jgi:drug/metabolite transporter (DMT)-like permease
MAIALALTAALAYGISDFAAGMASRRIAVGPVTAAVIAITLLTALVSLVFFPGDGPNSHVLAWGAASGLGTAVGTLSLYRGLSVGRMSVVATLSAVLAAVVPAIVGVALGDHLSPLATAGIVISVPAIALMSWQPDADARKSGRAGLIYGGLAGLGFALLFIALNQAGDGSGAWPVVPGQLVALVLVAPFAWRGRGTVGVLDRTTVLLTIGAGVLSGAANLLFLAATGHGQLAIIAVLTSLYPAVTVLLARVFLAERSTRIQIVGLVMAFMGIVMVSVG